MNARNPNSGPCAWTASALYCLSHLPNLKIIFQDKNYNLFLNSKNFIQLLRKTGDVSIITKMIIKIVLNPITHYNVDNVIIFLAVFKKIFCPPEPETVSSSNHSQRNVETTAADPSLLIPTGMQAEPTAWSFPFHLGLGRCKQNKSDLEMTPVFCARISSWSMLTSG